jgi:hypothetical protein
MSAGEVSNRPILLAPARPFASDKASLSPSRSLRGCTRSTRDLPVLAVSFRAINAIKGRAQGTRWGPRMFVSALFDVTRFEAEYKCRCAHSLRPCTVASPGSTDRLRWSAGNGWVLFPAATFASGALADRWGARFVLQGVTGFDSWSAVQLVTYSPVTKLDSGRSGLAPLGTRSRKANQHASAAVAAPPPLTETERPTSMVRTVICRQ